MIKLALIFFFYIFLSFSIPSPDVEGIDAVKQFAKDLITQGEEAFKKKGSTRYPSPTTWKGDILYSIQVDRFNNGNFSNDNENLPPSQKADSLHHKGEELKGMHEYRNGGDLLGIIDRLDYLKDLGVNSLWLTPVLKHNGDYHGYCTASLIEIDPGFGDNDLFATLVSEAHKRNIKIVLDVVINHLCDRKTYYSTQPDHYKSCSQMSYNHWNGISGTVEGQGELSFSDDFFKPLRSKYFFNRAGANSKEDMEGLEPPAVYGDFTNGMFDYDTRNYDLHEIFTDLMAYWIAFADVDGFRLDAAKHVTEDFLAYFSSKIRNYAESIGKTNFYIIGEVAGPADWIASRTGKMETNPLDPYDHGNIPKGLTNRIVSLLNDKRTDLKTSSNFKLHQNFPYPGLTAPYDFAHGGTARNTFRNEMSLSNLATYLTGSFYKTIEAQTDPMLVWNVLEIHDWPSVMI